MSSQYNKKLDIARRIDKLKTLRDFEKCALEESLDYYAKLYFSAGACSTSTPKHNEDAFSSSTASCSIEEIATEVSNLKEDCPTLWMQTYIHKDRSVTWDIIKKAESFGFSAIVVTVDSTSTGLWMNVMPEEFFEMVSPKLPNLPSLPRLISDASLTFEDLKWVIKNSKLPVIAKGILSGMIKKNMSTRQRNQQNHVVIVSQELPRPDIQDSISKRIDSKNFPELH
ncbi:hydroxyacid oxidase 1 [Caerostris extrusa]|uniref:Hydroxyacid oxidase 1 n=1 Tax=Caerostris extrusa TaxID=172846 RepID=A0AAV4UQI6_CAEEX|nr:hydroxyacid oxidase 1 [Caerostris extrusa]